MKVSIGTKYKDWNCAHTGKGKFIKRLIAAFIRQGIVVVDPGETADIDLQIGKQVWKSNATANIVRMGCPHFDIKKDYRKLNKRKSRAIKKADAVIYQSVFAMNACDSFLGKTNKPKTVIANGADPMDFLLEKKYPKIYKWNFVVSSRIWTGQKRLDDILKAFVNAEIEDCGLFVLGEESRLWRKYSFNNIQFLGSVDKRTLPRILKASDAIIHMVWLDGCSNAVVEAMAAGCAIICNSAGGTADLLPFGAQVIDPKYTFNAVDINNPPKVNMDHLIAAMKAVVVEKKRHQYPNICIDYIAQKYIHFFERVLCPKKRK